MVVSVAPRPYPEYRGCFTLELGRVLWLSSVGWMIVETGKRIHSFASHKTDIGQVVLVLMLISGYRACKPPQTYLESFS